MATNIKHIDSKKYNKALTLEDRNNLANIISCNRNLDGSLSIKLNDIAKLLQKDPTTISKKVKKRHSIFKFNIPNYVYTNKYRSRCVNSNICKIKDTLTDDKGYCKNFSHYFCKYTLKFPYVCNGCYKRSFCGYPKTF